MHYYKNTWQEFLSKKRTVATRKKNFYEWHKNRLKYYFWAVGVNASSIESRLVEAKEHLSSYLLRKYDRMPHVTIYVCGFMVGNRQLIDDYDDQLFAQHLSVLEKMDLSPFNLNVFGVNSFTTAPFLEVVDSNDNLGVIRNALISVRSEDRHVEYIPHITIGLYSGHFCCREVGDLICGIGSYDALNIKVNSISLMSYDSRDVGSVLRVEHDVKLESGQTN